MDMRVDIAGVQGALELEQGPAELLFCPTTRGHLRLALTLDKVAREGRQLVHRLGSSSMRSACLGRYVAVPACERRAKRRIRAQCGCTRRQSHFLVRAALVWAPPKWFLLRVRSFEKKGSSESLRSRLGYGSVSKYLRRGQ